MSQSPDPSPEPSACRSRTDNTPGSISSSRRGMSQNPDPSPEPSACRSRTDNTPGSISSSRRGMSQSPDPSPEPSACRSRTDNTPGSISSSRRGMSVSGIDEAWCDNEELVPALRAPSAPSASSAHSAPSASSAHSAPSASSAHSASAASSAHSASAAEAWISEREWVLKQDCRENTEQEQHLVRAMKLPLCTYSSSQQARVGNRNPVSSASSVSGADLFTDKVDDWAQESSIPLFQRTEPSALSSSYATTAHSSAPLLEGATTESVVSRAAKQSTRMVQGSSSAATRVAAAHVRTIAAAGNGTDGSSQTSHASVGGSVDKVGKVGKGLRAPMRAWISSSRSCHSQSQIYSRSQSQSQSQSQSLGSQLLSRMQLGRRKSLGPGVSAHPSLLTGDHSIASKSNGSIASSSNNSSSSNSNNKSVNSSVGRRRGDGDKTSTSHLDSSHEDKLREAEAEEEEDDDDDNDNDDIAPSQYSLDARVGVSGQRTSARERAGKAKTSSLAGKAPRREGRLSGNKEPQQNRTAALGQAPAPRVNRPFTATATTPKQRLDAKSRHVLAPSVPSIPPVSLKDVGSGAKKTSCQQVSSRRAQGGGRRGAGGSQTQGQGQVQVQVQAQQTGWRAKRKLVSTAYSSSVSSSGGAGAGAVAKANASVGNATRGK